MKRLSLRKKAQLSFIEKTLFIKEHSRKLRQEVKAVTEMNWCGCMRCPDCPMELTETVAITSKKLGVQSTRCLSVLLQHVKFKKKDAALKLAKTILPRPEAKVKRKRKVDDVSPIEIEIIESD